MALGVLLAGTVAGWTAWRVARRDFDAREHMPLDLCNLSALLSLVYVLTGAPLLAVWMVCFAAPGGVVSMIAPDLDERHGRSTRAKFWIVHPGLVGFGIATALSVPPPPRGGWMLGGLWLLLAAYTAVVAVVDWRLRANYLFLRHKPPTRSPLDRMGPWPFYLFPLTAIIMATMILVFLGWSCMWR
ncbi:MAG TPA: TIGR02206 family membrane protein [Longimicrobium sp.]|nr:TIGR02206 family membrane protein [Longimicrobium sp.]